MQLYLQSAANRSETGTSGYFHCQWGFRGCFPCNFHMRLVEHQYFILACSVVSPGPVFIKINVDASWTTSTASRFAGTVVRDFDGKFVASQKYSLHAQVWQLLKQWPFILWGCQLGSSLGFNSVIIEFDSLESISCLRNVLTNGNWEAFPTLIKSKKIEQFFQDCRWSWSPRSANMAGTFWRPKEVRRCAISLGSIDHHLPLFMY